MPASKPEHPARRAAAKINERVDENYCGACERCISRDDHLSTIIAAAYSERDRRVVEALKGAKDTLGHLIESCERGESDKAIKCYYDAAKMDLFAVRAALAKMEQGL